MTLPENKNEEEQWTTVIEPPKGRWGSHLGEIFQYKYLMYLFIKRDFQTAYKQTILGPLWFIIQPLMTTGIYSIIFSGIAKIPTDGIPAPVFYLSGQVIWGFFNMIFSSNSSVLAANAGLFGKVYFPRMAVPVATSISKLYNFGIQMVLFLSVLIFYWFNGMPVQINFWVLAIPFGMMQLGLLGLGLGLWASAWTVKYRDLGQLIGFGISIWMWASPIVYPLSFVTDPTMKSLLWFNPVSQSIEIFRYGFTGAGTIDLLWMAYSWAWAIVIFFIGLSLFNKAEKTYMDVV